MKTAIPAFTTLDDKECRAVLVDEVHSVLDWTSVVAKGSFHLLDPESARRTSIAAPSRCCHH